MTNYERYDAFTGLTILEKTRLINFLLENTENGNFSQQEITDAVERAVKERPSLGGFILTIINVDGLLGVIVVNRTGMERVDSRHQLSLLAIAQSHRHNGVAKKLIAEAIEKAGSGLSLELEPGNGEVSFFENLGFEKKYVVMQSGN